MTDFYSLLKQSIIERDIRAARDREAVYAQARQAVIKQLWAFQPPLAADEIDARVGAYDTAVERIEADLLVSFARGELPPRAKPARRQTPAPVAEDVDETPAPPLAEWHDDEPAEEAAADDEPLDAFDDDRDDPRGVPRAATDGASQRAAAETLYEVEATYQEHARYESGASASHDRWSEGANDEVVQPARRWWQVASNESERIQILAGAVAALAIALVVLGAYLYLNRRDDGVTVNIGVRREVSDAATAARIPTEKLAVSQTYSLFEGRDPTIFATTADNPVQFDSQGGFVRVSSSVSAPGVKAVIGPGLAVRLAGQKVRVTLLARSSSEAGAETMRFAYQSGLAISHWQTANLTPDYEPVGIIWRLPTMRTSPSGDYLVVEPGIPGDGTGVDIKSIKIDVLVGDGS